VEHKVNGSAQYSIDTRLDGLVYAAVKSNPVPWGGRATFNADAIKDRPGVIAVVELLALPEDVQGARGGNAMQNGVAVVADSWYRAKTALDLLPIEWDYGPNAEVSNDSRIAALTAALDNEGEVTDELGGDTLGMIAAAPA